MGAVLGAILASATGTLKGILFAIATLALSEGLCIAALMLPDVTGGAVGLFLNPALRPSQHALYLFAALAVMANEGAKALGEGVALRASDIDLAFIHGYGFPRTKGGPMWAADEPGLLEVFKEVEAAHAAGGTGSEPAPLLLELACSGGRFGTCDLARSGPRAG